MSLSSEQETKVYDLFIDDGPFANILAFLDARSLLATELTCTELRVLSHPAWETVAERMFIDEYSRLLNLPPKNRVLCFLKQQAFALRMEQLAPRHCFLPHYARRTDQVLCSGCEDFPDIESNCFENDDEYLYFVRLSQQSDDTFESSPTLVWEGFLTPRFTSNNCLLFDMEAIYQRSLMNWRHVAEFLSLWLDNGDMSHHHPDFDGLEDRAVDTINVTITATRWGQPYSSHLVVTTGGVQDNHSNEVERRMPLMMNPRNGESHGGTDDEDWVSSTFMFDSATSATEAGTFLGIATFFVHERAESDIDP